MKVDYHDGTSLEGFVLKFAKRLEIKILTYFTAKSRTMCCGQSICRMEHNELNFDMLNRNYFFCVCF